MNSINSFLRPLAPQRKASEVGPGKGFVSKSFPKCFFFNLKCSVSYFESFDSNNQEMEFEEGEYFILIF